MLQPVLASELASQKDISHAFFTRPGGVSGGLYQGLNAGLGSDDERQHVVENRKRMAAFLAPSATDIVSPYQVHSADVVVAEGPFAGERPKADALVTNIPGLPIGIVTADCGPVLFADPKNRVIGAAHAGWKGALTGVLENTITAMEQIGADKSTITAILGPTISHENYEVGPDFPSPFLERSQQAKRFFSPSQKSGHHMFDLTGYIVDRLLAAGIAANAVNRCTYGDEDNFYSYRRATHRSEADYGRQMSAIVLDEI